MYLVIESFTIPSIGGAGSGTGALLIRHKCGVLRQVSVACSSTNFDFRLGTKASFAQDDKSQIYKMMAQNKWFVDSDFPVDFHNTDDPTVPKLYYRVDNYASSATDLTVGLSFEGVSMEVVEGSVVAD